MSRISPRRISRELSPEERNRLMQDRQRIEEELPDLVQRDRMRKEAAAEQTLSGDLRRALHASPFPLPLVAARTGIDAVTLDEFLTGERTLRSDVMDRLAACVGGKMAARGTGSSELPTHEFLMRFRRYARAVGESQRLCQQLVARVFQETGALPVETAAMADSEEPPFLVYRPPEAMNFALIETIDRRKTGVVISIYGEPAESHTADASSLRVRGKARRGYSKIAIRKAAEVSGASDLVIAAYQLKVRQQQATARRPVRKRIA